MQRTSKIKEHCAGGFVQKWSTYKNSLMSQWKVLWWKLKTTQAKYSSRSKEDCMPPSCYGDYVFWCFLWYFQLYRNWTFQPLSELLFSHVFGVYRFLVCFQLYETGLFNRFKYEWLTPGQSAYSAADIDLFWDPILTRLRPEMVEYSLTAKKAAVRRRWSRTFAFVSFVSWCRSRQGNISSS